MRQPVITVTRPTRRVEIALRRAHRASTVTVGMLSTRCHHCQSLTDSMEAQHCTLPMCPHSTLARMTGEPA